MVTSGVSLEAHRQVVKWSGPARQSCDFQFLSHRIRIAVLLPLVYGAPHSIPAGSRGGRGWATADPAGVIGVSGFRVMPGCERITRAGKHGAAPSGTESVFPAARRRRGGRWYDFFARNRCPRTFIRRADAHTLGSVDEQKTASTTRRLLFSIRTPPVLPVAFYCERSLPV